MTPEEAVKQTAEGLKAGTIDRDEVLAEIYIFTQQFSQVMAMMQNGAGKGLIGRLLGGKVKEDA